MGNSNWTKICYGLGIFFLLMPGLLRIGEKYWRLLRDLVSILSFFFIVLALFIWSGIIKKRIIQLEEKKYILGIAAMLVFMILIRTIKYLFFTHLYTAARYVWYLYYIPLIIAPLWLLFAVLHIGMGQQSSIDRRWKMLYFPAGVLLVLVLFNDFHQGVFHFQVSDPSQYEKAYTYGIIYYMIVLWIAFCGLATLAIVVYRCRVDVYMRRLWLPMLPFLGEVIYTIMYIRFPGCMLVRLFEMAEMVCFLFPAYVECLIVAGLFPVNDNYELFWNASRLCGGIMDNEGNICFQSSRCVDITKAQVLQACEQKVLLDDGNGILKSHRIEGGYGYWVKDVRELHVINEALRELGNVQEEENEILTTERMLQLERAGMEEKKHIYRTLADEVLIQRKKLRDILQKNYISEQEFEHNMAYAAVLYAYVKRYSNLLMLSTQQRELPEEELLPAFRESIKYLRLAGIEVYMDEKIQDLPFKMESDQLVMIYHMFEDCIEAMIPTIDILFVRIWNEDGLCVHMEANCPSGLPQTRQYKNISMKTLIEDATGFVDIRYIRKEA